MPSGREHMDAVGDDVGDVEPPVGADLESVGDGIVAGQAPEILDAAVRAPAADAAGVGLAPDDRAVGFHRNAIGEDRLGKGDEHARGSVRLDREDVAGIGAGRIVGAGIGEDQASLPVEDEVVGAVERDPGDLGEQDLGLAALADALDRGRGHLGGAPGPGGAAVLADIEQRRRSPARRRWARLRHRRSARRGRCRRSPSAGCDSFRPARRGRRAAPSDLRASQDRWR